MKTRLFVVKGLCSVVLAAVVAWPCGANAGPVPVGHTWNRSADWTVRPDGDIGTTNGNPDDGSLGNPVWQAEWAPWGNPLGNPSPWYEQSGTKMIWVNWYGSRVWGKSATSIPQVKSICMNASSSYGTNLPLVRWINSTGEPVTLDLSGTLKMQWYGGSQPTDMVIAHVDASESDTTLLYSHSFADNTNHGVKYGVNIPGLNVDVDDQIIISYRVNDWTSTSIVEFFDNELTLTVVPEPTSLVLLAVVALGLLLVMWRRRR